MYLLMKLLEVKPSFFLHAAPFHQNKDKGREKKKKP